MSLHDRAQAVFFQCGNNNDGRTVFAHVRGLQDRHSMHPRVHFQNDRNDISEIFPAEMEKLF